MRKITYPVFLSVDGVMQAPGGDGEDSDNGFAFGGWTGPHFDERLGNVMDAIFARPFDLLLGRRTYDIFAAYWPNAMDGEDNDLAIKFNAATKYVATSSDGPFTWSNTERISDVAQAVPELKHATGPDILVQGSSQLAQALHEGGLIDEYVLITFPVILGQGKKFFGSTVGATGLQLKDTAATERGVIVSRYTRSGPVQTRSVLEP